MTDTCYIVFVLQETLGLFDFEANIVFTRLGTQTNFLRLAMVSMTLAVFLFALLVLVFAVIHDAANGGFSLGATSTRSKPTSRARANASFRRQDTELLAFVTDNSDLRDADLIVYSCLIAAAAVDCFVLLYKPRSS